MDINEAIKHLKFLYLWHGSGVYGEAMSMAIGALRAQQAADHVRDATKMMEDENETDPV